MRRNVARTLAEWSIQVRITLIEPRGATPAGRPELTRGTLGALRPD